MRHKVKECKRQSVRKETENKLWHKKHNALEEITVKLGFHQSHEDTISIKILMNCYITDMN